MNDRLVSVFTGPLPRERSVVRAAALFALLIATGAVVGCTSTQTAARTQGRQIQMYDPGGMEYPAPAPEGDVSTHKVP